MNSERVLKVIELNLNEKGKRKLDNSNYYIEQIEKAVKDHDFDYTMSVKFSGMNNESNYIPINEDQLKQIKNLFATFK